MSQAAAAEATAGPAGAAGVQPHLRQFPSIEAGRLTSGDRGFVEEHRQALPFRNTSLGILAWDGTREAASNHAVAMWGRGQEGFAADPMLSGDGLIFVMTRLQIQMDEYPKWGDVVQVETWFFAQGRMGAQRDFVITDRTTRRQLGRATSSWVMISLHTRRLSRVPEDFRAKCLCFTDDSREAITQRQARQKLPELDLPPQIVGPTLVARRSDIDMNGHVNNVAHLAWGLETVPQDVYDSCTLVQIEIDFKAEARFGDLIQAVAQQSTVPEVFAALPGAAPPPPLLQQVADNGETSVRGDGGSEAPGQAQQAQHAQLLAFVHSLRRVGREGPRSGSSASDASDAEGAGAGSALELTRMRTLWRPRI
ncbi:hypothetical protein N2152v2_000484 [Parachlorella kessleri]